MKEKKKSVHDVIASWRHGATKQSPTTRRLLCQSLATTSEHQVTNHRGDRRQRDVVNIPERQ